VAARAVLSLAATARSPALSPSAAAILDERLQALASRLEAAKPADEADLDLDRYLARLIRDRRALDEMARDKARRTTVPPGMPIGEDDWFATPAPSVTIGK
jgi:hypothetical protein